MRTPDTMDPLAGSDASCDDVADLLAGAALGALSPSDAARLQQHLARCAGCERELDSLRETSAALALALAPGQEPPRSVRQSLLAAAQREPPLPSDWRPRRLLAAVRRFAPAWGIAAAGLALGLGSFAWAASLQARVATLEARASRYDRVVAVLASTSLTTRELQPSEPGLPARGTLYLDPASRTGMVMVHDLPPLGAGRTWQLWYVRGADRVSGGLLRTNASGTGYALLQVPTDLERYDSVGITEEPAGGSAAPTSARVIGTQL